MDRKYQPGQDQRIAHALKRFAKVELKPGESQIVAFALDERAFAFYDPYQSRWVVEPGVFEVLVGSSSHDIRARMVVKLA